MQDKFEIMLPLPQHWTSHSALLQLQDKLKEKLSKIDNDSSIDKSDVPSHIKKEQITKNEQESESRSANIKHKTLLLFYLEVLQSIPEFIKRICRARDIYYLEYHYVVWLRQINLLEWLTNRLLGQPGEQLSCAKITTTPSVTNNNNTKKEKKEEKDRNASLEGKSPKVSSGVKDADVVTSTTIITDDNLLRETSPLSVKAIFEQYPYSERCWKELSSTDYVVRCLECGADSTCVMCIECFTHSPCLHHKHEIMTSSGSARCDCGDEHAWKAESFCSRHRKRSYDCVSIRKNSVNDVHSAEEKEEEEEYCKAKSINHTLSKMCHSVKFNTLDEENVTVKESIVHEMNEHERGYAITLLRCLIQMITLLLQQGMEANNMNKRKANQQGDIFAKLNKAVLKVKVEEEIKSREEWQKKKETTHSESGFTPEALQSFFQSMGDDSPSDCFHTSSEENTSWRLPKEMSTTNCQEIWSQWLNKVLLEPAKALKELSTTGQCARTLLAMLWREEAPLYNTELQNQENADVSVSKIPRMSCLEVLIRFDIYYARSAKLDAMKVLMDSYANCMHLPIVRVSLAGMLLKYGEWLNFHSLKDFAAQSEDDVQNDEEETNAQGENNNDEADDANDDEDVWEELNEDDNFGLEPEQEQEEEEELEIRMYELTEQELQEIDENDYVEWIVNEDDDHTRTTDNNENEEQHEHNIMEMVEGADNTENVEMPTPVLDENDLASSEMQTQVLDMAEETFSEDHPIVSVKDSSIGIHDDDNDDNVTTSHPDNENDDTALVKKLLQLMKKQIIDSNRSRYSHAKRKHQAYDTDSWEGRIRALASVDEEMWENENKIATCKRKLFPAKEHKRWHRFEKSGSLIVSKLGFQVFFSKDIDIELVTHPSSMFAHCTDTSIHRQLAAVLFVLGSYVANASEKASPSKRPFQFWQEREDQLINKITRLLEIKKLVSANDLIDVLRFRTISATMNAHENITNEMIYYELETDEQHSNKLELKCRKALHKSLAAIHTACKDVQSHLPLVRAVDMNAFHINHNHWYSPEDVSWKCLMKLTWPQESVLINSWTRWENFINFTPISSLVSVLSRTAFRAFLLVPLIFTLNTYMYKANHPFHEWERSNGYVDDMYIEDAAPLLLRSFSYSLNGALLLMQYRISELLRRMALPNTNCLSEEEEESLNQEEEYEKTQKAEMYKCLVDYVGNDTLQALRAHTHFNYFPVVSVTPTDKVYTERRQVFEFLKNVCALATESNITSKYNENYSNNDNNNNNNTVEDYHKSHTESDEVSKETSGVNNDTVSRNDNEQMKKKKKKKEEERESFAFKTTKPTQCKSEEYQTMSTSVEVLDSELTNNTMANEALLVDLSTLTQTEKENYTNYKNSNNGNDKNSKLNQSKHRTLYRTNQPSPFISMHGKGVNFSQAQLSYASNLLQEIFYFLTVQLHIQHTECISKVDEFQVLQIFQRLTEGKVEEIPLDFESSAAFTRRLIVNELKQKNTHQYNNNNNSKNEYYATDTNNIEESVCTLGIVQYNLIERGHATTFSNYQSHMFKLILQAWLGVCGNTSMFVNDKYKTLTNTSISPNKHISTEGNNEKRVNEFEKLMTQAEIEYDLRQRLRFTTSSVLRFCHLHYKLYEHEMEELEEEEEEQESQEFEQIKKTINSRTNNGIDALCVNDQERPLFTLLCTFWYNYFNTAQQRYDATCTPASSNNNNSNSNNIIDDKNNHYYYYMERKNKLELLSAVEGWLDMLVMPSVLSCQVQNGLWRRNEFHVLEHCTDYIRNRPFIEIGSDVFILQVLAMCYPAPCEFTLRILERFTFKLSFKKKYVICINNNNDDDDDDSIGNIALKEKKKKQWKDEDTLVETYVTGYSHFLRLILTIVLNSSLANTGTHLNLANLASYVASLLAIRREPFSQLTTNLVDETHHEWVREEMEERHIEQTKKKSIKTIRINVFDANGKVMQEDERVEKVLNELAIKQPYKNGTLFKLKSVKLWHSFVSLYEVQYIDNDLELLYENYCQLVRMEQLQMKTQESLTNAKNTSKPILHIKIPPTRFPTRRTCCLDSSSQYVELIPHVRLLLHTDAVLLPAMYVIVSFAQQIDKTLFAKFMDQWPDENTQIKRQVYVEKNDTCPSINDNQNVLHDVNTYEETKKEKEKKEDEETEVKEPIIEFTHHLRYYPNSLLHPITALYLCVKDSVEISYGLLLQEQEKDDDEEEEEEEEEEQSQSENKTTMQKAKNKNSKEEMLSYAEYVSLLLHEKDAIDTSSQNLSKNSVLQSGNTHTNSDDNRDNNNNIVISSSENINGYMWQNVDEFLSRHFVYDYSFSREEVLKYLPLKQLTKTRSLPDILCTQIATVQNTVSSGNSKEEQGVQTTNLLLEEEEEEEEQIRKKEKSELHQDNTSKHEVNQSTIADALRVTQRYFKENPKEDHFSLAEMIDFILRICGFTQKPSQHNKHAITVKNKESITSAPESTLTNEEEESEHVLSAQDRLWQRQRQILERQQKRDRKRAGQLLAKNNAKENITSSELSTINTTIITATKSNTIEVTGNKINRGDEAISIALENEKDKMQSKPKYSPLLRSMLQTISEYVCCICGVDDGKPLYLLMYVSSSGVLPHLHHPRIGNLNNVSSINEAGKVLKHYSVIGAHVYSCSHCAHASCAAKLRSRMEQQYYSANNRGLAPEEFFCPLCLMTCNVLCPLPKVDLNELIVLQLELWKKCESLEDAFNKFTDEASFQATINDWYNTLKTNAASSLNLESWQRLVSQQSLINLLNLTAQTKCTLHSSAREKVNELKKQLTFPLYNLLFSELYLKIDNAPEEKATHINSLMVNIEKACNWLSINNESNALTLTQPVLNETEQIIEIVLSSLNAIVDQLYTIIELANVGVAISSKQLLTVFTLLFSVHEMIKSRAFSVEEEENIYMSFNKEKQYLSCLIFELLDSEDRVPSNIEKYMLSLLYTSVDYENIDFNSSQKQYSSQTVKNRSNADICRSTIATTKTKASYSPQDNDAFDSDPVEYFIPQLQLKTNTFSCILSQCLAKYHLDVADSAVHYSDNDNNNNNETVNESSEIHSDSIDDDDDDEHKLFPLWCELVCLTFLKLILTDDKKVHLVLSTSQSFSYPTQTVGSANASSTFTVATNNNVEELNMAEEVYISALLPANTNSFELRLQSMMHMIEFLCNDVSDETKEDETEKEYKCTDSVDDKHKNDNSNNENMETENVIELASEFRKYSTNNTMLKLFNKLHSFMHQCNFNETVSSTAFMAIVTDSDHVEHVLPPYIHHFNLRYFEPEIQNRLHTSITNQASTVDVGRNSALMSVHAKQSYSEQESLHVITDVLHHPYMYSAIQIAIAERENKCCECQEKNKELLWCCLCGLAVCVKCVEKPLTWFPQADNHLIHCCHGVGLFINIGKHEYSIYDVFTSKKFVMDGSYVDDHDEFRRYRRGYSCLHLNLSRVQRVLKLWMTNDWAADSTVIKIFIPRSLNINLNRIEEQREENQNELK